jgi:hypothetical protein
LLQYRRIAARRGKGRAVVAVGHSVLVPVYYMLTRRESYRELGAQYFDEHERDHVQQRLRPPAGAPRLCSHSPGPPGDLLKMVRRISSEGVFIWIRHLVLYTAFGGVSRQA